MWFKVSSCLPPAVNKFGESDPVLCIDDMSDEVFVGWYNVKSDEWHVAHYRSSSEPVKVSHWANLPKKPKYTV